MRLTSIYGDSNDITQNNCIRWNKIVWIFMNKMCMCRCLCKGVKVSQHTVTLRLYLLLFGFKVLSKFRIWCQNYCIEITLCTSRFVALSCYIHCKLRDHIKARENWQLRERKRKRAWKREKNKHWVTRTFAAFSQSIRAQLKFKALEIEIISETCVIPHCA